MSRKRAKNRADDDNGFAQWGGYMEAKKAKLSEQFDVVSANLKRKSEIFRDVSITVNGYTQPSADELKFLMAEHGGTYHLYQNQKGVTTHVVATNLPNIKINQGNVPVVHPKWITDSIEANKLLDFKKYLLYSNESRTQPKINFAKVESPVEKRKHSKTANDPEFLSEFYNNSRLHLISTLGAEFKQLVNELREKSTGDFPGLTRLIARGSDGFVSEDKIIMHIDMDCFFVSVGLRKRPELRGKPVAVTHSRTGAETKSSMSEIASCSYEARRRGVHNGMFMGAALKLCPDIVPIPYDFEAYKEVSRVLYGTVAEYTVDIEAVSCDEMYVDVGGVLRKSKSTVTEFAEHVRGEITSRTGCPCSAGFGSNRLRARMATKRAKPDGQFYLKSDEVGEYFKGIALEDLPGVGWSTLSKLNKLGLKTCGDVLNVSLNLLKSELGQKNSQLVYDRSRGIDDKPLNYEHERKSVSADVNYGIRFKNDEESLRFLESLSGEVFSRLTDLKLRSKCVTLKLLIRAKDAPVETPKYLGCGICDSVSRTASTNHHLDSSELIFKEAKSLYLKLKVVPEDLRGVGIQLSRLEKNVTKSSALTKFLSNDRPKRPIVSNNLTKYYRTGKSESMANKKKMSVDLTVLRELPEDIQKELIREYDIQPVRVVAEPPPKNDRVRKKGFSDLSPEDLRMLLRNWITTETEPKEIDVNMLGDFLKRLAVERKIEELFPLVKFIYRHIYKMSCDWHEAYFKLLERLQEGMRESFGNALYVSKKFSCDKHC